MQANLPLPALPAIVLAAVDFPRPRTESPGSHLRDLHLELQACQRRLGTSEEKSDDFDRARSLAHEINNRLTVEYLREQLETMPSIGTLRLVA